LFNQPIIAYSGENDKQIQAAQVMEEAFAAEGQVLDHRIGPGMDHIYHPDTLAEIMTKMKNYPDRRPNYRSVRLQTQTLRYHKVRWVEALRLEQHWQDSRIDASHSGPSIGVRTKNIAAFRLRPKGSVRIVTIDNKDFDVPGEPAEVTFVKRDGAWTLGTPEPGGKRPGLQGPIDDAFMTPFLVVTPSGKTDSNTNAALARWVAFELDHLRERWATLFRAQLPEKRDVDVTDADIESKNLILWGDAESNALIKRLDGKLPQREFDAATQVHAFIHPNPLAPDRYVVLNSGVTFRPGHDRTNSQQNPKLPDWAVLDITQAPTDTAAGRVVASGFFDENWDTPSGESY